MTGIDKDTVPGTYNGLLMMGSYVLVARYPSGLIKRRAGKNLVTSAGESLAAALMDVNGSETAPGYLSFGTGTEGALKADTQLQIEGNDAREAVVTSSQVNNVLELVFAYTAGYSYVITEMGIFNASVAGTLVSRFITQALTVEDGVDIDLTWALTFSGVD